MTDKAIEALENMRGELEFLWRWIDRLNGGQPHDKPEENWRDYASAMRHYPGNPMDNGDWSREQIAAPIRAALEAKAEPDEPSYDETVEYICRGADNIAGVISDGNWTLDGDAAPCSIIRDFLDDLAKMLAGAGARLNENNDGLVFPAPPTTAEVKAQALEDAAEALPRTSGREPYEVKFLLERAKRLREEG